MAAAMMMIRSVLLRPMRMAPLLARREMARPPAVATSRLFATSSGKESLTRVLKKEESHERQHAKASRLSPPSGFAVRDIPGLADVALTKQFGNEEITVSFVATDLQTTEQMKEMGIEPEKEPIEVLVEIAKPAQGETRTLIFTCGVVEKEFALEAVTIARADDAAAQDDRDHVPYEGPNVHTLDESLQIALRDYLDERGIGDKLAAFIEDYHADKEQREYVQWLTDCASFIEA